MKVDLTRARRIRGPQGEVEAIRLPGGGRWSKPAGGPAIAAIPGYLWHLDQEIPYAASGTVVPEIPLSRPAGPLTVALKFLRTSNGVHFNLRLPGQGWFNGPFVLTNDWETEVNVRINSHFQKTLGNNNQPFTQKIIVMKNSIVSNSGYVDSADGTTNFPDAMASDFINIGTGMSDTGQPWNRAAGTFYKGAIFARASLTAEELAVVNAFLDA